MANATTVQSGSFTVRPSYDHTPNYNLIDLDYPLYGTTVVRCGGRLFDMEVVRKALALAAELGGELKHG